MSESMQFTVNRKQFAETALNEVADCGAADLGEGEVLLRVDRFALTANNISYAATGDLLRYWEFFPADEGMGIIPVWGFADVVASRCDGVESGERVYGYFPMATHLVVRTGHVSASSFVDVSPHRATLAIIYNQYLRCVNDPLYRNDTEDLQMLLRPLFTTSFLLDDFLEDNDFFGAETVVLTSASSKTALGMAFLLHRNRDQREHGYEVVGLTSPSNLEFVEDLGCYDRVLCYDEMTDLDVTRAAVVVDFAGNGELLSQVHEHYGDQLRYSCLVGASHWDKLGSAKQPFAGPEPVMFFAPTQAEKRLGEWGAAAFQQNLARVWGEFTGFVSMWMQVETHLGAAATEQVYQDMLAGRPRPNQGHVVSLWNT